MTKLENGKIHKKSLTLEGTKINIRFDMSGSKNMACGEPLCNRKIKVLDMSLVGTKMFVYRYCNSHWKLHQKLECESDKAVRSMTV